MSPVLVVCFLIQLFVVGLCDHYVAYNKVSVLTTDGTKCMTTCIDGNCYIDTYFIPHPCKVKESEVVPVFNTLGNSHCLSNCGKWGGTSYIWCYTSTFLDWDYCNDEIISNNVNDGRDIYGTRCVSKCQPLETDWFGWKKCHTNKIDLQYQRCVTAATLPVSQCDISEHLRSKRAGDRLFDAAYCASRTCINRFRYGADGDTDRIARNTNSLYNNINTITNFQHGDPYIRVLTTTQRNGRGRNVLMPLVMETIITDPIYQPRSDSEVSAEGVRNVNYMYNVEASADRPGTHVGHLLGYANGGTPDLFNYAGQTAGLNTGPYRAMETMINSWLRHGHVSFNVAVLYDTVVPTRPSEFYVKIRMYNSDGTLHADCLDMIFKNN